MAMRYDSFRLDAKRTGQGFLQANAIIARTGVQLYRRSDGTLQREYRPPETVFDPIAMQSFSLAPLTLGHPPVPVTVGNAKSYAVGTTGEVSATKDGKYVSTRVVITDQKAIDAVERGDARELSCGYQCDLDWVPGISPDGERYDAVQRNVRGNHVALVRDGRAGSEVSLKLDSADFLKLDENDAVQADHYRSPVLTIYGGRIPMTNEKVAIHIDGSDFRVKWKVAKAIEQMTKAHTDEITSLKSQVVSLKVDLEKMKNRADEAEKKATSTEENSCQRAAERFTLEERARKILGTQMKLDEMTDDQVRRAVVTKLAPDIKLDGKDEAYVLARYDVATEDAEKSEKRKNASADARFGIGDPNRDVGRVSSEAGQKEKLAREKMKTDGRDAYKKTLEKGVLQ